MCQLVGLYIYSYLFEGYDVFLSYRVASDAILAERLNDKLTARGVRVWWDQKCLPQGQ
jgi:hypothetical protein